MNSTARVLLASAVLLTGCYTTKRVAVSTFRVLDAPANYIRHKIDESDAPETTTTTTTTTTQPPMSDVTTPGRAVNTAPPPPPRTTTQRRVASETHTTTSPRPRNDTASSTARKSTTQSKSASASNTQTTTSFPTAKPVPGKPGFVYSIDPKGGIIDVTGYKPGDKAKDPYTQQIFIVP